MGTTLDAMRRNCRLITRIVAGELFPATIDLGNRLPADLFRARMVCIPVLFTVARDQIDRQLRGLPVARGPSINAVAASLDLPFETVRRNVQRMAELDWIDIGETGGLALPDPIPATLTDWCLDLAARMRRAATAIADQGVADADRFTDLSCDHAAALAGLDLMLAMASTASLFELRYAELLLVHFVCNASVAHLNASPAGTAPFAQVDTVPDASARSFVPLGDLSRALGLSRSTVYRIVSQGSQAQFFERRGHGVRATEAFLTSPTYVEALEMVAGRAAMLLSRAARHRCGMGCAMLDSAMPRTAPWRPMPMLPPGVHIG